MANTEVSDKESKTVEPTAPPPWYKLYWKKIAIGVVSVLVAASIIHSIFPAFGFGGSTSHKSGSKVVAVPSKAPTSKPVDINGIKVGAGGPIITLNPGLVRPDTQVAVSGNGFDARSSVDILLAPKGAQEAQSVATASVSKDGAINISFNFPGATSGVTSYVVIAKQRNSDKSAQSELTVSQGVGFATLSTNVGKPGDSVGLSVQGFSPGEELDLFWGRMGGTPTQTLTAGSDGTLTKASIKVGAAAVGNTTLFVVGKKSASVASVPFQVLSLYPSLTFSTYAVKALQPVGFSGKGFAPNEKVDAYLNTSSGQPILTVQADQGGSFTSSGFVVPYGLKGGQSVVLVGQQSRASVSAAFTILPYNPSVRVSTYSALPGTTVTFFGESFGPNEAVHVFLKRLHDGPGELVAACRADGQGKISACGSFLISSDLPNSVTFELVGQSSDGKASTSIKVDKSAGGNVPAPPKYVLPKSLER